MAASTILYLGTRQGTVALKSADGTTWETQSQGLRAWDIPKLAVLPSQPNRVVAGTRGDGVWVSEDFGETWKKPSYGKRGPGKVRCVTIDPNDPDTIYAGTEPIDIFASQDGARTWDRLDSVWEVPSVASVGYPVAFIEPHVREIVLHPNEPTTMYAALQVGYMLKSTDSGGRWRLLDQGLDEDVHSIVIDPKNPDRMFIATGGEGSRGGRANGRALYMSQDAGETWSPTALEFPHFYSVPMAMHPEDTSVVYAGMATGDPRDWNRPTGAESLVVRTVNGGETWEKVEGGLEGSSKVLPVAIVFDEQNPDHMYVGLQSGELYASKDGGASWSMLDVKVSSISYMVCVHA